MFSTVNYCLFFILLLLQSSYGKQQLMRLPSKTECEAFADDPSNCLKRYMNQFCAQACLLQQHASPVDKVTSFYQLKANDLDGRPVDFQQYKQKVVLIANVASYDERTKEHYSELNTLYSKFGNDDSGSLKNNNKFEILAFPCNQFGGLEPDSPSDIQYFCKTKHGVKFKMMEKVNVNGMYSHLVYSYLKRETAQERDASTNRIEWNFDTYYLVSKKGIVTAYSGVRPIELESAIVDAFDE